MQLSRSKLELYVQCPRCAWLDLRHGVRRPSIPGYTINTAIDSLLKEEFDECRRRGLPHPVVHAAGLDLVPYDNPNIHVWQNAFEGIRATHEASGLTLYGGIDDVWVDDQGTLYIVDYKSTGSTPKADLYPEYKRQMEVYQWLFARNGFIVSPRAYFVYAYANKDHGFREGNLTFDLKLIAHEGNTDWVAPTLEALARDLKRSAPDAGEKCSYCVYRTKADITLRTK